MPIWPVSFVDGSYQVADADGALYPLTMQGNPVTSFNPGWSIRGLQTGLAPFHILELEHEEGLKTFWLLDAALDYRANAVVHLQAADRALFDGHLDMLVRNLFNDAVKAPHAAIPAAAHEFDGFLPESVIELIRHSVFSVMGKPEVVAADALATSGSSYGSGEMTVPVTWLGEVLRTPIAGGTTRPSIPAPQGSSIIAQERLDLPGHACFRFLDPASGQVAYLLVGEGEADRHLFLPNAGVVFTIGPVDGGHDPLLLLMVYYATHTDRAVMLPEMEGLEPGLVHATPPPQSGLDEPSGPAAEPEPPPPAPVPPPLVMVPVDNGPAGVEAIHAEAAPATTEAYNHVPRSYEGDPTPAAKPQGRVMPEAPFVEASPKRAEGQPVATRGPPRQNWWQRLLGLGND